MLIIFFYLLFSDCIFFYSILFTWLWRSCESRWRRGKELGYLTLTIIYNQCCHPLLSASRLITEMLTFIAILSSDENQMKRQIQQFPQELFNIKKRSLTIGPTAFIFAVPILQNSLPLTDREAMLQDYYEQLLHYWTWC